MTEDEIKTMKNEIAREFWVASFEASNPNYSKEDINNTWNEVSSEYRKVARTALARLERKKGIAFYKK